MITFVLLSRGAGTASEKLGALGRVRDRVAFAALMILAAALPFESNQPLLVVGPLGITSVELLLYAAILLWAVCRPPSVLRWGSVHSAVAGCALATIGSAVLAPSAGLAASKFALRSLAGLAIFFVVSDLTASARRVAPAMLALGAGSAAAALWALGEAWLGGIPAFHAGDLPRVSGPFPYPNVAAMYWEATLPLVLVSGAHAALDGRARRVWLAAGAGLAMLQAIAMTLSRAGLAIAVMATAALLGAAWRGLGRWRALVALTAFGAAALLVVDLTAQPGPLRWLRIENDRAWYAAEYRPDAPSIAVGAGQTVELGLRVRNVGSLDWSASDHATYLGHEWLAPSGAFIVEGPQIRLGRDVPRGSEWALRIPIRAPAVPGRYTLRWQLGGEGFTWSRPDDDGAGDVSVEVAPDGPLERHASGLTARRPPQGQPTRVELWRAGLRMWRDRPLVGVGPDGFRRLYAGYLGARALDDRVTANNLYVETLADLGSAGGLALAWLACSLALAARRAWVAGCREERVLTIGLAAGLASFFVHGLVDCFLAFTSTGALFWLLAGLLAAQASGSGGK